MSKELLKVNIPANVKPFKIANFTEMLNKVTKIGKKYEAFSGTPSQNRKARIKLNKFVRAFNKQRRTCTKPYRNANKGLKNQTDMLCAPIKKAVKHFKVLESQDKKARQINIKNRLMIPMHQICQSRNIPDQPIPKDALKLSLTNVKRLDLLAGSAEKYKDLITKENCFATKKHQAVNAQTGEIMPHLKASNLTFVGDDEDYKKLMNFVKKNNICLK